MDSRITLILALLAISLGTSSAIQCYSCYYLEADTGNYGDNFCDIGEDTEIDADTVSCDACAKVDSKIVMTDLFVSTVTVNFYYRGCSSIGGDYCDDELSSSDQSELEAFAYLTYLAAGNIAVAATLDEADFCVCQESLCNSAAGLNLSVATLIASVVAYYLRK